MFPRANFTHWNIKDKQGFNPFAEYGDYSGVDFICEDSATNVLTSVAQKSHSKNNLLVARDCVLPIHPVKPTANCAVVKEFIHASELKKHNESREAWWIKRVDKSSSLAAVSKGHANNLRDRLRHIYTQLNDPEKKWFSRQDLKNLHVPTWICKLMKEHEKQLPYLPMVEKWHNANNCLNYIKLDHSDSVGTLFYLTGGALDTLTLSPVTFHENSGKEFLTLEQETSHSFEIGSVHEITIQRCKGKVYCLALHDNASSVIPVIENEENRALFNTKCVCKLDVSRGRRPISGQISPYLPCECIIALDSGDLCAWDFETGRYRVVHCSEESGFPCTERWLQTEFGSHPRCYTLADRTCVKMLDFRTSGSSCTDLFGLSEKFLQHHERVRATKFINQFWHLIATDNSLFVIDERLPKYPLLEWGHSLKAPVKYIDTCRHDNSDETVILLAGHDGAPFVFQLSSVPGEAPRSLAPAWRVASVSDAVHCLKRAGFYMDQEILDRVRNAPCIGTCAFAYPEKGFSIIQNTIYGDMFYQVYEHIDDDTRDKTCTLSEGQLDSGLTSREYVMDEYKKWGKFVEVQMRPDTSLNADTLAVHMNVSKILLEISKKYDAHRECCLCNAMTSNIRPSASDEICKSCGLALDEGQVVQDTATKESFASLSKCISSEGVKDLEVLHFQSSSKDNYSKKICELWNGKDDDAEHEDAALPSTSVDFTQEKVDPTETIDADPAEEMFSIARSLNSPVSHQQSQSKTPRTRHVMGF